MALFRGLVSLLHGGWILGLGGEEVLEEGAGLAREEMGRRRGAEDWQDCEDNKAANKTVDLDLPEYGNGKPKESRTEGLPQRDV